jgi:ABC-type phosphate transport system substrate-binding protein
MRAARAVRAAAIVSATVVAILLESAAAAATRRTRDATRDPSFVIVVNDQNSVVALPRGRVSRFFLKKALRWDSGVLVQPVDLPSGSSVREAFSRRVLEKSVGSVRAYWQQQIFSGRAVPPIEKPTDDAVLEFVRLNAGAIGYVSTPAALPRGVRTIEVTD